MPERRRIARAGAAQGCPVGILPSQVERLILFEEVTVDPANFGSATAVTIRCELDLTFQGVRHGRDRAGLAATLGQSLGIIPTRLRWDHVHDCGAPECPEARSYEDVYRRDAELAAFWRIPVSRGSGAGSTHPEVHVVVTPGSYLVVDD